MKLEIYFYVQDHCEVCTRLKEAYELVEKSHSTLSNVPIYKVYPTQQTIQKYGIKHVPTMIIVDADASREAIYKEVGFIDRHILINYLETLKSGGSLATSL